MNICILGPCRFDSIKNFLSDSDQESGEVSGFTGTGGTPVNELINYILTETDHNITLITFDKKVNNIQLNGARLQIRVLKKTKGSHYSFFIFETLKLIREIRKVNYDVIHAHWPMYAVSSLIVNNKKSLITLHDNPKKCLKLLGKSHFPHFLLSHILYKYAENISVVSEHIKRYISSHYKNKKVDVIRNIHHIDEELSTINKLVGHTTETKVIVTGNSSKLKNIKTFIVAIKLLNEEKYFDHTKFVVELYGPGLEEGGPFYHSLNLSPSVCDIVQFKGNVSHEYLISRISQADLMIHPSLEEAFPGPIIESLLLKTPVIAGAVGDIPIILKDGKFGMLIDVSSSQSICNGIKYYDINKEKMNKIFESSLLSEHLNILLSNQQNFNKLQNKYNVLFGS